jgi:hypothetical protein
MMQSDPLCAFVVGVTLILLVVLSHWHGRGAKAPPVVTKPLRAKRAPKPFAGFIHKPDGPLCEPEAELPPSASVLPCTLVLRKNRLSPFSRPIGGSTVVNASMAHHDQTSTVFCTLPRHRRASV